MDYMTAGELAQNVGITLRSVQYYDQLGLLRPSERGPNNLRLYSEGDQQRLYQILVLKYLGLTLSQIRDAIDEYATNDAVEGLINARIAAVETEFHDLFRRLQALYEIRNDLGNVQKPDWHAFAATIENVQDQGALIWQIIATIDDGAEPGDEATTEDALSRREYLVQLHELFGEAMELMRADEPLTSAANRDFAARARALLATRNGRLGASTLIMGNMFHTSGLNSGFDQMTNQVTGYIQAVIDANEPLPGELAGEESDR